jgi:hypothetical protein
MQRNRKRKKHTTDDAVLVLEHQREAYDKLQKNQRSKVYEVKGRVGPLLLIAVLQISKSGYCDTFKAEK